MWSLEALALALPPRPERVGGRPTLDLFLATVLVAALLWATLLCWWTRPARRSAQWLAGACFLVLERSLLVTHLALSDQKQPGRMRAAPAPSSEAPPTCWSHPPPLPQRPRESLRQAGFTPAQIDRLLLYRQAYRAGYFHPDPAAPARLAFARWLYQHGKLSG